MPRKSSAKAINSHISAIPIAFAAMAICCAVFAAVIWASQTALPTIARAPGQIGPMQGLVQIDHFDGGIVRDIRVLPGDVVREGDLIAVVEDPSVINRREVLQREISGVSAERTRAEHVLLNLDRSEPAVNRPVLETAPAGNSPLIEYIVAQDHAFRARRASLVSRTDHLLREAEVAARVRDSVVQRVEAAEINFANSEQIFSLGHISRAELDARRAALFAAREDQLAAELRLVEIENSTAQVMSSLAEAEATWREELHSTVFEISSELATLEAELIALSEQRERFEITAPRNGIVQNVHVGSVGAVVPPGGSLADLLAEDDHLVAVVRLSPRDIGHVNLGYRVRLRVTTFDFRQFGGIEGRVVALSPTTELDEQNVPFFRLVVELDSTSVGTGELERQLSAGMEVSAEIITSERTVLAYFFSPAERILSTSLQER